MKNQTVGAESETLILMTCFHTGQPNSHLSDCSVKLLAHIAHRLGKKKQKTRAHKGDEARQLLGYQGNRRLLP